MGKEFVLNSLSVMKICTLSDRIPFWSKIYIFKAWCVLGVHALCFDCFTLAGVISRDQLSRDQLSRNQLSRDQLSRDQSSRDQLKFS